MLLSDDCIINLKMYKYDIYNCNAYVSVCQVYFLLFLLNIKSLLVYNKKQVISSFKSKEKAYEFH